MNKKSILITGGAGFIGSCLVRHLIRDTDYNVINLDKLTYAGNLASVRSVENSDRYFFHQGDICDKELIDKILCTHTPFAIINLAAESHVDRSIDGPSSFIKTNILGTFNLLDCSLNYWTQKNKFSDFRFLHVSTDEVYGSLGTEGSFSENTKYDPSSPYSASKASSDHLVRAWGITYGLPILITNSSNNYGPYQYPEKLIPLSIQHAILGKKISVYGDGQQIRDWIYVDDHVKGLLTVLRKGNIGDTYNIGGNSEKSNLEVVQKICHYIDELLPNSQNVPHNQLVTFVADRPGHDRRYAINCNKLKSELKWTQEEHFDAGLKKTVKWFLENQDWVNEVLMNKNFGERLGKLK